MAAAKFVFQERKKVRLPPASSAASKESFLSSHYFQRNIPRAEMLEALITYQVGDVGNLNGVLNNFDPSAPVPLFKLRRGARDKETTATTTTTSIGED